MAQPAPPMTSRPASPERRSFFQYLTALTGALATLALSIPLIGYLIGPLIKKREEIWVDLGPITGFPVGQTRLATFDNPIRQPWDGMTAHTGVYVRNLGAEGKGKEKFQVFAINCAHLGCPVTWFPQAGLFMCPCHGGVYYENGDRASGPPPRGLFACVWRLKNDKLEVQAPHLPTLQDTLTKDG